MLYLVIGSGGPGFESPDEALEILEGGILPTFDALMALESSRKILAGGLPVGERTFMFIAEAASHDELDHMIREIPAWGFLDWEVTPLQSFTARAAHEQQIVEQLKAEL